MNRTEALAQFAADRPRFEELGIFFPGAMSYLPDEFRRDYNMAMDSLGPGGILGHLNRLAMDAPAGTLSTDPNSALPALLTTYVDPERYEVLFAPVAAAKVLGEVRKADWLADTAIFPIIEHTTEVSSYGDRSENGMAGANANYPQFQAYLFQTIMQYGERELERMGLLRLNWLQEINRAAAAGLSRYLNYIYLFGVRGMQNYGLTNDPALPAALTPSAKANGGVTWFTTGGAPNAAANEVYNDIIALYEALVIANLGVVDSETKLVLALSPASEVALKFTNTFNVNVQDLLTKNFKNLRIQTVPQYQVQSTGNPQGVAGGNLVQLIAEEVETQKTGYCAYNEKMRTHPIIRAMSSFRQKATSGGWGAIIRYPAGFQQMIGV